MPDLKELREKAEAATAGPWDVWKEKTFTMADAIRELTYQVECVPVEDFARAIYLINAGGKCPATTGCGPTSEANAAFIAAANPTTILALLDRIESAERERDAWKSECLFHERQRFGAARAHFQQNGGDDAE